MSDPPLSDINFKNKMAWVWTTLNGFTVKASSFYMQKIINYWSNAPDHSYFAVSEVNNFEFLNVWSGWSEIYTYSNRSIAGMALKSKSFNSFGLSKVGLVFLVSEKEIKSTKTHTTWYRLNIKCIYIWILEIKIQKSELKELLNLE